MNKSADITVFKRPFCLANGGSILRGEKVFLTSEYCDDIDTWVEKLENEV